MATKKQKNIDNAIQFSKKERGRGAPRKELRAKSRTENKSRNLSQPRKPSKQRKPSKPRNPAKKSKPLCISI